MDLFDVHVASGTESELHFSNGFQMYTQPFEKGCKALQDESFDLVFTSPPYFDYEMYSSANPSYSDWIQDFYTPLMKHSCRLVRPGGHVAIHIDDTSAGEIRSFLISTVPTISSLVYVYKLGLRGVMSNKIRPVWVFRKPLKHCDEAR
jgi:tRNA1(Val) A37 N6-methylase TrmN6